MVSGDRERQRQRRNATAVLREPLCQHQRLVAAVVETAEAHSQLLELHGLGARAVHLDAAAGLRLRSGLLFGGRLHSQWWPNRNE